MKSIIFILILGSISILSCQKNEAFWDRGKLDEAISYAEEIGTYALIIQTNGKKVASYGDIDKPSRVHSVRKAILMALVSQHLDKIDLQSTLAELNIDDYPIPLTELQRKTKVIHLLKSTSGINHPAVSQVGNAQTLRDSLLGKNPNIPGTKWAYNNWDYNALTTIFENNTELTILEAFENGIAKPLGIKDYESFYRRDTTLSLHAKAGFRLSTRDMAKFGQLFLNMGFWDGHEIIPKAWIKKITNDYTLTGYESNGRYGHGYLWWIPSEHYAGGIPQGSYITTGSWGQRILVIPKWSTIIVHKTMTDIPSKERTPVTRTEFEQLVYLISQARINNTQQ